MSVFSLPGSVKSKSSGNGYTTADGNGDFFYYPTTLLLISHTYAMTRGAEAICNSSI
jgi:hypothetical protein